MFFSTDKTMSLRRPSPIYRWPLQTNLKKEPSFKILLILTQSEALLIIMINICRLIIKRPLPLTEKKRKQILEHTKTGKMIYQQSVKANLQTLRARGKNWMCQDSISSELTSNSLSLTNEGRSV